LRATAGRGREREEILQTFGTHTAAHQALRPGQSEPLRSFFFRLEHRRKPFAVAMVAVARKLVLQLYVMLREGIDYQEFRRRGRDARRARGKSSPAERD